MRPGFGMRTGLGMRPGFGMRMRTGLGMRPGFGMRMRTGLGMRPGLEVRLVKHHHFCQLNQSTQSKQDCDTCYFVSLAGTQRAWMLRCVLVGSQQKCSRISSRYQPFLATSWLVSAIAACSHWVCSMDKVCNHTAVL